MDDERRTADEHADEPLREEDLRRDEVERRGTAETERVSVVNEPQRSDDDEFRWHTGLNRPTGVADAVEFVEGVRPQQATARPEHGHPRGSRRPRPLGHRQVGARQSSTWSGCAP